MSNREKEQRQDWVTSRMGDLLAHSKSWTPEAVSEYWELQDELRELVK